MNAGTNIVALFVKAAHRYGSRVAFIEKAGQTTYTGLLQQVQQTAARFAQKDIGKGDTVLVFVPMTTQLYIVVLALLYRGAVPVFLDEWVSLQRLKACLQTVHCKAMVAPRRLLFISWFVRSLWPLKKIAAKPTGKKETTAVSSSVADVQPDDTALVTFTTGSTGIPKAANRTHRFLQAQYDALHPLLDNDCITTLTLLPVVVLLNLCLGKTNILPAGKVNPAAEKSVLHLLQSIQQHAAESLIASPAIVVALAKIQLQQNNHVSIRQVVTGGGPVFPEAAKAIATAFPDAETLVVYGSTEAEPVSILSMQQLSAASAETLRQKGLPVGSIHPDIEAAIVPFSEADLPDMDSHTFAQLQLPFGSSGELLVSGPHVLQQYLNNDAAQRQNKFWVNGKLWHRTGDEATVYETRHLYFLGRCKEVIVWQGQKLYPLLFTWHLKQHIAVQEAALLLHHNQLLLVLQKADFIHEKAVKEWLRKTLPEAAVVWVKAIPKDKRHHTKIDYERLRQRLQ